MYVQAASPLNVSSCLDNAIACRAVCPGWVDTGICHCCIQIRSSQALFFTARAFASYPQLADVPLQIAAVVVWYTYWRASEHTHRGLDRFAQAGNGHAVRTPCMEMVIEPTYTRIEFDVAPARDSCRDCSGARSGGSITSKTGLLSSEDYSRDCCIHFFRMPVSSSDLWHKKAGLMRVVHETVWYKGVSQTHLNPVHSYRAFKGLVCGLGCSRHASLCGTRSRCSAARRVTTDIRHCEYSYDPFLV